MSQLSNRPPPEFACAEDPEFDAPAFATKPIKQDRDHEHMDALQVVCAIMGIAAVMGAIWVIGPTISAMVRGGL